MLEDLLRPMPQFGRSTSQSLPFEHPPLHPLSSGTTGIPKGIVHGAGGTLLQHLKEHQLHVTCGLRPLLLFHHVRLDDVEHPGLSVASGATLLMYDDRRLCARAASFLIFAQAERMTHLGTSAKFIDAVAGGLRPVETTRFVIGPGVTIDRQPTRFPRVTTTS